MRIALFFLGLVLLAGCSAERRAQRHLDRAIRLNPKVISEYTMDTIIRVDTVLVRPDTVFVEGDVDSSLVDANTIAGKLQSGEEVTLIDNDRVTVTSKLIGDSLQTKADVKPQYIYETDTVRVTLEKEVKVPGKEVRVTEYKKGLFHKIGVGACILVAISIGGIMVRRATKL